MVTVEGHRSRREPDPARGRRTRFARPRTSPPGSHRSPGPAASSRPVRPSAGPGGSGPGVRPGRGWPRVSAPGTVPAELVRLAILVGLAILVIGLLLPALVELAERSPLA